LKLGQKALTYFKGTIGYCGESMNSCMMKKNYVDLYLNDVICLKTTI